MSTWLTDEEGRAYINLYVTCPPLGAVLCLVKGEGGPLRCYFTTKPLSEQWGDDWNDVPHQCNAGRPYGMENVSCVIVDGAELARGEWSVKVINEGTLPWLVDDALIPSAKIVYAGTTLRDFIAKCDEYGWALYWPVRGS